MGEKGGGFLGLKVWPRSSAFAVERRMSLRSFAVESSDAVRPLKASGVGLEVDLFLAADAVSIAIIPELQDGTRLNASWAGLRRRAWFFAQWSIFNYKQPETFTITGNSNTLPCKYITLVFYIY